MEGIFPNRAEAGRMLGLKLSKYAGREDVIVLGLPRGGVPVAYEVAQALRPAFAGLKAGDWVDPSGETRDVEVRLSPESRRRAADLAGRPAKAVGERPHDLRSVHRYPEEEQQHAEADRE